MTTFTYRPFEPGVRCRVTPGNWFDWANCQWRTDEELTGRLECYIGPIIHFRTDSGGLYKGTPYDLKPEGSR